MRLQRKHDSSHAHQIMANVCNCVSTGDPAAISATRAETKKEHAPLLSQVSSIMAGKVIDYTPRWADRAGRGPLQRSRYSGWHKQAPSLSWRPPLSPSSTFHDNGLRWETPWGISLLIRGFAAHSQIERLFNSSFVKCATDSRLHSSWLMSLVKCSRL